MEGTGRGITKGITLEGLRKATETSVRIVDALARIRTGHFSNGSQKCYNWSQLAQCQNVGFMFVIGI
jgi:hypothetical protein